MGGPRIAMVGSGSLRFVNDLLSDLFRYDDLAGLEIALHDIDPERLELSRAMAERLRDVLGSEAAISAHADRRAALEGADYVIVSIRAGGHDAVATDLDVPRRYGVRQTTTDTIGIGAIFRGLCTMPAMRTIAADVADVCPEAWLLSYTNPMAMLCSYLIETAPGVRTVGLCQGLEDAVRRLAALVAVPYEEVAWSGAGVNHQSFVLRFERDGENLYERLDQVIARDPELARRARFEAYRRLGFFPSESSEHFADLVPWFLPHDEMIERFRVEVDVYLERSAANLRGIDAMRRALADGEPIEPGGYSEYAPRIIHSLECGVPRVVYANVPNDGLIANLPPGSCVEVPCLVDALGLHPLAVGALPPQIAALNQTYINVVDMTVRAAIEGSRQLVECAALLDPNTAASITPDAVSSLCGELIAAHSELLPAGIAAGPGEE
jgi:alpha-galactosidase